MLASCSSYKAPEGPSKDFIKGCTVGSSFIIQQATRRQLATGEIKQLGLICDKLFYLDASKKKLGRP